MCVVTTFHSPRHDHASLLGRPFAPLILALRLSSYVQTHAWVNVRVLQAETCLPCTFRMRARARGRRRQRGIGGSIGLLERLLEIEVGLAELEQSRGVYPLVPTIAKIQSHKYRVENFRLLTSASIPCNERRNVVRAHRSSCLTHPSALT
jgi:hypothetical protein